MSTQNQPSLERSAPALTLAGLAALLASVCCVFPLVFALVGISGAWISQLRVLQPYSTGLIVLSCASLGLAGWRIFRMPPLRTQACNANDDACGAVQSTARRWFWLVAILTLIPILVPLAAPLFY